MTCLEKLPVEIIDKILSYLVLVPPHYMSHYMKEDMVDTKALLSLTKTSRLYRSLALPILFRSIDHCHTGKYILNMFNSHKGLAQSVKALSMPFARHSSSDYSHVQDTAPTLGISGLVSRTVQEGCPETAESSLALALCSSVERLKISLPDSEYPPYSISFRSTVGLFRNIVHELETVPCLKELKYLEFDGGDKEWRYFMCGIPRLLQVSPRLEVLVWRGTYGKALHLGDTLDGDECRPALESLREVHLLEWPLTNSDVDIDVLERMFTATTRLKTFVYVSEGAYDWGRELPPQRVVNMLLPVQSTLEHLTIDYGQRALGPDARGLLQIGDIPIDPNQLKLFTSLKTLEIDQSNYCRHQLNRKDKRAIYLADLLPLTICKLTIYLPRYDGGYQCMDCILYFARRVVAGDFPALEYVQVDAQFFQHRSKDEFCGERRELRWTRHRAAMKTKIYNRSLRAVVRGEEKQKKKVIEAFAGSGVEISYRASQTVTVDEGFEVLEA